jgi:hypothetical protein
MHLDAWRKNALAFIAAMILGAVVAGFIIAALHRASVIRDDRVSRTVAEIRRGNYFAWNQARHWWGRLSESERSELLAACEQYGRTNRALH